MKKLLLMLAGVTVMGITGMAQETDYREDVHFGIKGGLNYSNVYDSEGEEFDANPKLGLAGGAFLAIPLGKYFGVQPEILISQRGFQASGNLLGSEYNVTRTTTFLDVPLLLAIKPSEFITLLVGPQYSYLLKQKDKFTSPTVNYDQEKEFSNDNIRRNILCVTGGLDINIQHLVLGARAGWDVTKNHGDGTSSTPRYKNVWYQATVGYRF